MESSPSYIIVWEYEVQTCLWVPYDPEQCRYIERAFCSTEGKINLGRVNPELASLEIDFVKQKEENMVTRETRRVRQKQYPSNCVLAKGVLWKWWSDFNWVLYDVPTMMYIESEYFQKHHGVDLSVSPLGIPNVINFSSMTQINKMTKKQRRVRRFITEERYPLAVFQGRSSTRTAVTGPMLASTASRHHQHHNFPQSNTTKQSKVSSGKIPVLATSIPSPSSHLGFQDYNKRMKSIPQQASKPSGTLGGPLANFTTPVTVNHDKMHEECPICLQNLMSPSEYDLPDPGLSAAEVQCISPDVVKLLICKHMFHKMCLQKMYNIGKKNGCLQCPTCKTIHGIKRGNQPKGGSMDVKTNSQDIPGYPGSGSIVITYNFKSGIQDESHPNPGQRYVASGFPRTCYLPNNVKGQKVLKLLKMAFEQQLIFTIGISVTTGLSNTVTWNDIHHKTEGYQNTTGHGYPDPNYLDVVVAELATHGITEN